MGVKTRRPGGLLLALALAVLALVALGARTAAFAQGMTFFSTDFAHGGHIPVQFTCDGENVLPELEWSGSPTSTESFVLVVDDPDAPMGTWVHFVLFNIPLGMSGGWNEIGTPGRNSWGETSYGGPCPPPGDSPHRYFFRLYALDTMLELPVGATRSQVETAMWGHVLAEAQVMGYYGRMPATGVGEPTNLAGDVPNLSINETVSRFCKGLLGN